jgi:hypothetical protein
MVTPAALGAAICARAEADAKTARAKTDRAFILNTLSASREEYPLGRQVRSGQAIDIHAPWSPAEAERRTHINGMPAIQELSVTSSITVPNRFRLMQALEKQMAVKYHRAFEGVHLDRSGGVLIIIIIIIDV